MEKAEGKRVMYSVLQASYDSMSDVLYFSLGDPVPNETEGVANGLELGFDQETGAPCGGTVVGYRQYEWPHHLDKLAAIIGNHLGMAPDAVETIVSETLRPRAPIVRAAGSQPFYQ